MCLQKLEQLRQRSRVNNAYKPEGFPIDENGQSVNIRDYERDEDT